MLRAFGEITDTFACEGQALVEAVTQESPLVGSVVQWMQRILYFLTGKFKDKGPKGRPNPKKLKPKVMFYESSKEQGKTELM